MNGSTLHRRVFVLHLQERADYERLVLIKEPAQEHPTPSHIAHLNNEHTVTKRLADMPGVRLDTAKA